MNKYIKILLSIILMITLIGMTKNTVYASLEQRTLEELSVGLYLSNNEEQKAYDHILLRNSQKPGCISAEVILYFMDMGYLTEYEDEFKALGYIPSNSSTSTPAINPAPAPELEPFTVEMYSPAKTMWATGVVNCRSGASTSYEKVSSLAQYEEVSVTGVASTGWYEVTKDDGTKIYVSNNYLTEEDPNISTVYDYDEETNSINTYEFTATDPEIIDALEEQLDAEEETTIAEEVVTEAFEEPETIVKETIEEESTEIIAEDMLDNSQENNTSPQYLLIIIGICTLTGIVGGIVVVKKARKEK